MNLSPGEKGLSQKYVFGTESVSQSLKTLSCLVLTVNVIIFDCVDFY